MMYGELKAIGDPVLKSVQDHPFWSGLRDGRLPGAALAYFVQQDTAFLLPAYARSLARCAASAQDDADAFLLAQSVGGTLEAKDRLRSAYTHFAAEHGLPGLDERPAVARATHAQATFFTAAGATSFCAGIGALLPMVWFNHEVSDRLRNEVVPGSRYAAWSLAYHPGDSYRHVVRLFLELADRAVAGCSDRDRQVMVEHFSIGVRYEWEFAQSCLLQASWPV